VVPRLCGALCGVRPRQGEHGTHVACPLSRSASVRIQGRIASPGHDLSVWRAVPPTHQGACPVASAHATLSRRASAGGQDLGEHAPARGGVGCVVVMTSHSQSVFERADGCRGTHLPSTRRIYNWRSSVLAVGRWLLGECVYSVPECAARSSRAERGAWWWHRGPAVSITDRPPAPHAGGDVRQHGEAQTLRDQVPPALARGGVSARTPARPPAPLCRVL
jgi:hypothetical protein